jgi:hypothetical protein
MQYPNELIVNLHLNGMLRVHVYSTTTLAADAVLAIFVNSIHLSMSTGSFTHQSN